jgi:hypothetical protein
LKNNRPVCIEDYIIAYCEAKKSGLPLPETTLNISSLFEEKRSPASSIIDEDGIESLRSGNY